MKIYTRTGDAGETGLFGGGRVPKDHLRVAAYGELDELNAAIGVARATAPRELDDAVLDTVQRDLFTIGAELAAPDPAALRAALARHGPLLGDDAVAALEAAIDAHEAGLAPLASFILPGGTPKAAALHFARTVCRRAERAAVALAHREPLRPVVLRYLNRLSDLLFVLARAANARAAHPDVAW